MSRPQVETATSRVERLLTMVPWLVGRQGIEISRAAEGLGIVDKVNEAKAQAKAPRRRGRRRPARARLCGAAVG